MKQDTNIVKMMELSTAHISEDTRVWIVGNINEPNPLIIYEKEVYGWYIPLTLTDINPEDLKRVPSDLLNILRIAEQKDCQWIMLDGDGPIVGYLPQYDW